MPRLHDRQIVTCLPCGYREPVRAGNALPPRCPNCGAGLERFDTSVASLGELRDLRSEGTRMHRVQRPRLVIGAPA